MFDKIKGLALSASSILLNYWEKNNCIEIKNDNSPVTEADRFISNFLTKELKKVENLPVVSEEDLTQYLNIQGRYWLIDPLDGTKDFIKKDNDFAINIALMDKNFPIFSAIIVPRLHSIYFSQINEGAYAFHNNEIQRLYPSLSPNFSALVSKNHHNLLENEFLEINNIKEIQKVGASIKFCKIATGQGSIYARFDKLHSWDVAAGHLLVKEAGYQIYDLTTYCEPCYPSPFLRVNPFIVLHKNYHLDRFRLPCTLQ